MKRTRRSDFIVALTLAALGVLLLIDVREISFGVGYDRIGPRFFPYLVSAGLILLGIVLATSAFRNPSSSRHTETRRHGENHSEHILSASVPPWPGAVNDRLNRTALVYVGAALVLCVLLLDRAGFIVASCIQFWLVARALQSRRPARDLTVGIVLSIVVYVVFSRGLGLTLPPGVLF